jgi:hypothetical protein
VLDQADEGARAFGDVLAVLVEELEEVSFARQQLAEKHVLSLRPRMSVAGECSSVPLPGMSRGIVEAASRPRSDRHNRRT